MLNFADATASAAHPFVGLRPFTFEDAAYFFGREQQVDSLERLVSLGRMVSVVGSSGSGKSSLIRAGVLPRLSAEARLSDWDWVEMRPGEAPVRNLAEALARPNRTAGADALDPLADARADRIELVLQKSSFGIGEALTLLRGREGKRLLILVDQFEEIFRFADLRTQRNSDQRRAAEQRDEATFFVQLLLSAVADESLPACIMLTMRSDFIGECARFHGLSEAVTETQYLVPGLTREQRATAVRGPMALAGGACDAAVVQRLLNDSNEDPDQLPVMQHTVMRCWQRASEQAGPTGAPHITLADYTAIGGFEGALTRHGDEVLASLVAGDPDAAHPLGDVAKRVFQSLTEVDSQGRVIRRPQTLADLASVMAPDDAPGDRPGMEAAVRRVVLHFADPACSFLRAPPADDLTPGSIIDIGHEALIRRWERLGGLDQHSWVREEQGDAESYRTLLLYSQDGGLVPRGQLRVFENWWDKRRPTRFWARRYSRGGEDRLAIAAAGLQRSRGQVVRDKRVKRIAIAAACLLLAVFGGLTLRQQQRENERLTRAAVDRAVQQARLVAVEGLDELRSRSPHEALLLANYGLASANGLPAIPETQALAYEALNVMRERSIFTTGGCGPSTVAFMPNGVMVSYAGGELAFWNAETGTRDRLRKVRGPGMPIAFAITSDPSGRFLLMSGQEQVLLYDLVAGASTPFGPPQGRLGQGAFSPDGKFILTAGRGTSPRLWQFAAEGEAGSPPAINMVHDFANNPKPVRNSGGAAISAGSRFVAIGASDTGAIQVYAVDGFAWMRELAFPASEQHADQGATHGVISLVFDPSEPNRLVATYANGNPQVWDLRNRTGTTLDYPTVAFSRAALSPDGRYLAITGGDERVRVWDMHGLRSGDKVPPNWVLRGSDGPFFSAAFDAKDRLATGSNRGKVWLWDVDTALSRGLPDTPGKASQASQATTLTVAGETVTVQSSLPGIPSGALRLPPDGLVRSPFQASVSANGAWGLVAPSQGPILLYNLHTPESPIAALGPAYAQWKGAQFAEAPDRIIGASASGRTRSWRFFHDEAALLAFSQSVLPTLDDGQTATLPEATRQKLQGDFWTVLGAMKTTPDEAACASGAARQDARATSPISQ